MLPVSLLPSSRAVLNYSDVLSRHDYDTILNEQSKQPLKLILIFEDKKARGRKTSFLIPCSSGIGRFIPGQGLLLEVKDKREAAKLLQNSVFFSVDF
jgi:hypothetical protein